MATIDWKDYDLVHKHLEEVRQTVRDLFITPVECPIEAVLNSAKVESPIEAVFIVWLELLFIYGGQVGAHAFMARAQQTIELEGERFRPDFIMVPSDPLIASLGDAAGCPMKLAVELDGYDFHERTKEQVAIRDRRDRVLQRHGWVVLHISGSELVRRKIEALEEVWLCSRTQLQKLREAVAKEWGAPLKYGAAVPV